MNLKGNYNAEGDIEIEKLIVSYMNLKGNHNRQQRTALALELLVTSFHNGITTEQAVP